MAVSKKQLYANQITAQTIQGVHPTLTPRSGKSHYVARKSHYVARKTINPLLPVLKKHQTNPFPYKPLAPNSLLPLT